MCIRDRCRTLTDRPFGVNIMLMHPQAEEMACLLYTSRAVRLAVKLGAECIAVAKGCGVRMEPHSLAGDLDQVFVWGDEDTIAGSVAAVRKGWEPHRKLVASMAQDLAHGRKCEIDAINGVASESGVDAHVPTPINDMVVHVVKGIQDGKWKGSFDNLKFFEGLY